MAAGRAGRSALRRLRGLRSGWCSWCSGRRRPRCHAGANPPTPPFTVGCLLAFLCLAPQDLPGALSEAQVAEALGLHDIRGRPWAIYKTSAIKGEGLTEGLDWLSSNLSK